MPKKTKVNKLARMSDEERARYLQHRADVEEEARRRKYQLVDTFIKNKLNKEETYSKINRAKINQGWRFILRKIKCNQMALIIKGMMCSFNFLVHRKDRHLESLMRAIEDSNEQHRRAFQAHTESLSYFMNIGSQRLDKLQADYENRKITLLESWDVEEQGITESQDRAEFKLTLIKYIQNRDFKSDRRKKEIERATLKNDTRLEHEADMHDLCKPKKLELDMYWDKLRDVYDSYLEKHNPIMGHYHMLQEKDNYYQREILKSDLQIQEATEEIATLQAEWIKLSNNMDIKVKKMIQRKGELAQLYRQKKKESKIQLVRDTDALNNLVNESQDAVTRLQHVKEKLEKILLLSEICSKYEDIDEANRTDPDEGGSLLEFDDEDGVMAEECRQFSKMYKFILKSNRVKVQTICLKSEKAKLSHENVQLKQYIKRYLTELALKGGQTRPQSVKLYSAMEKVGPDKKYFNRPVTCIEGALSNAVMHEKRQKLQQKRNKEIEVRAYPRQQCW